MLSTRFDGAIGARVEGVDLAALDDELFGEIHRKFLDHSVLVFPDQKLSPAEMVEFSRRFGKLIVHPLVEYNHPDQEEIFVLSNVVVDGKPKGLDDGGSYWHSDYSYKAVPALATILYGVEIPERGGDTLFVDMYRAYETLGHDTKTEIEGLKARHWLTLGGADTALEFLPPGVAKPANSERKARLDPEFVAANPPTGHPIVRVHPETGRKALFVHPSYTHEVVGMSDTDGKSLLRRLFAHSTQPEFQIRHRWSANDLVVWDNRCTMHAATTSGLPKTERRTVYRTSVDAPVF